MTTRNILFEDLLETIVIEESEPSYEALTRWIERFPEHQEALTSFFATWAVQEELPESVKVDEYRIANLMVSRTLDQLYQRAAKKKAHASGITLLSAAAQFDMTVVDLSNRTKLLDESILMKLNLRRIIGNIPQRCFELLSNVMVLATHEIQTLVTGPPIANSGSRHKSRTKPTLTTESFSDAVKASSLSPELKEYWYKEIEDRTKSSE